MSNKKKNLKTRERRALRKKQTKKMGSRKRTRKRESSEYK